MNEFIPIGVFGIVCFAGGFFLSTKVHTVASDAATALTNATKNTPIAGLAAQIAAELNKLGVSAQPAAAPPPVQIHLIGATAAPAPAPAKPAA